MQKAYEVANSTSCLNKALMNEMMFILLARDPAAPAAIDAWILERVKLGLNRMSDDKIKSAIKCKDIMLEERKRIAIL